MTLRACLVLLSEDMVLSKFIREGHSRNILAGIQQLASVDETKSEASEGAHRKFLSSLPVHEARCGHLMSLIRLLSFRIQILDGTEESEWKLRVSDYLAKISEAKSSKAGGSGGEGSLEGSKTPPAESGSTPSTPPVVSSSGASGNDGVAPRADASSNRAISQSTAASDNSEEDDDSEAAATAAAHLREAAIAQMAELGLPRSWSELALRRTGGTNIEAAVHFCLERGGEMERLLAEERERERMMQRQSSGGSSGRRRGNRSDSGTSNHLLRQLLEMGFPSRWCAEALAATGNNVDEALTWILTNGERLSAEDEGMEEEDDEEDLDDDDDEDDSQDDEDETVDGRASSEATGSKKGDESAEANKTAVSSDQQGESRQTTPSSLGWTCSVIPLRFISGRSIIDPSNFGHLGAPYWWLLFSWHKGGASDVGQVVL